MKIPKLSPKQQVIAAGVGFLIVIIAFVFLFLVPQIVSLGAYKAEETTARQELEVAKTNLKQLEDIKRMSRKTESEMLRQERKTPEEAELPSMLIQIEEISKKAGLTLVSVKPASPIQKENYKDVPIDIQVKGYFYPLLDFVYRMEKLPRLMQITYIEVKEEPTEKLPSIQADMKAHIYILTPGVKPTAGAGGGGATPGASATGAAKSAAEGSSGGSSGGGQQ